MSTKYQCNFCINNEDGYRGRCEYKNPYPRKYPKFCPETGESCLWQNVTKAKESRRKNRIAEQRGL